MNRAAIYSVLLVFLLCATACDREKVPVDPWNSIYGDYSGKTVLYVPADPENPEKNLSGWIPVGEIATDVISILPGTCSGSKASQPGCIRIYWEGACALNDSCDNEDGTKKYNLDLAESQVGNTAFKSSTAVGFIPRGEVYPGSGFSLPRDMHHRTFGMETFESRGLYLFDFNPLKTPDSPYHLFIFTGIKELGDEDPGGAWHYIRLWGQEKNDHTNESPGI